MGFLFGGDHTDQTADQLALARFDALQELQLIGRQVVFDRPTHDRAQIIRLDLCRDKQDENF